MSVCLLTRRKLVLCIPASICVLLQVDSVFSIPGPMGTPRTDSARLAIEVLTRVTDAKSHTQMQKGCVAEEDSSLSSSESES